MYYKHKYDGISRVFDRSEVNMPDDIFEAAMERLIAKGLFEKRIVNGKPEYSITELGLQFGELRYAKPKNLN